MTDTPPEVLGLLREHTPRVTVVGDVILDRWLRGGVQRLSREAPVPVVDVGEPEECPGGAANTAMNLAALGASVRILTVVAADAEGHRLRAMLDAAGIDTSAVVVRQGGSTPSKTRIVGGDQILVRVDHAGHDPLDDEARSRFHQAIRGIDARETVLVCDYGMGLLDDGTRLVLSDRPRPQRLIIDAHDLRPWATLAPDLVTPNGEETATLLGRALPAEGRADAVAAAAREVLAAAGSAAAVVTLDRDGTVVLERGVGLEGGAATHRTYAQPAPEHQAAGAGDTFAAALAAACAVGATLPGAAAFAQRAADVVVSRPGTAVCTLDDLGEGLSERPGVLALARLREELAAERARGRRIVFTNGCFDVLHPGHTAHLQQAKDLGDVLVVALNDDASVRRLKGRGRPVNPVQDRAAVIGSLGCVDYVTVFAEDSPVRLLDELRPEIYAKGGDYTPEMLEETAVVLGYGGEVRILDFISDHSTTHIVDRIAAGSLLR